MNILWHSVAPWVKSGYGIQTGLFSSRINQMLNHSVSVYAYTGLQAGYLNIGGITIFPKISHYDTDIVGNNLLAAHAGVSNAELIITLTDIWTIDAKVVKALPWAPWFPIDHDPIPPKIEHVLKESKAIPMVFSKFAVDQVKRIGMDPIYIPHGCHPEYFKPADQQEARQALGFPESRFIIGLVGVNNGYPNRKGFTQALEAIHRFQQDYPDTFVYFHCLEHTATGIDFKPQLSKLAADSYISAEPYQYSLGYNEEYMCNVYAAMDVLLAPSMGEGFGVPIIEAQAMGKPVIVSDFTAMSEHCFYGEKVGGTKFLTNQHSYQLIPDINQIVEALERVRHYDEQTKSRQSAKTRKRIKELFDPDMITDVYWQSALEECKRRLKK